MASPTSTLPSTHQGHLLCSIGRFYRPTPGTKREHPPRLGQNGAPFSQMPSGQGKKGTSFWLVEFKGNPSQQKGENWAPLGRPEFLYFALRNGHRAPGPHPNRRPGPGPASVGRGSREGGRLDDWARPGDSDDAPRHRGLVEYTVGFPKQSGNHQANGGLFQEKHTSKTRKEVKMGGILLRTNTSCIVFLGGGGGLTWSSLIPIPCLENSSCDCLFEGQPNRKRKKAGL